MQGEHYTSLYADYNIMGAAHDQRFVAQRCAHDNATATLRHAMRQCTATLRPTDPWAQRCRTWPARKDYSISLQHTYGRRQYVRLLRAVRTDVCPAARPIACKYTLQSSDCDTLSESKRGRHCIISRKRNRFSCVFVVNSFVVIAALNFDEFATIIRHGPSQFCRRCVLPM
jgi:hypothetical protein